MKEEFNNRLNFLKEQHKKLEEKKNEAVPGGNGVFERYRNPVLTAMHIPLTWKYDLNPATNPYLMERFGINATLNAGAIKWNDKYALIARVEGTDRKSFFAVADSDNGIDNFQFWDQPVIMPETDVPD